MARSSYVNPWITLPRPNPRARLRLLCLPHAGGGAQMYRSWPADLPDAVEVCAVTLPGRESRIREEPPKNLESLVGSLVESLADQLTRPFAIFGHSMGALIGFELIRMLRRQGLVQPVHLIASGRSAPQIPDPDPPIHTLPRSEFVEELRRLNGMPNELLQSPEVMGLVLPTLRKDFEVCETYRYVSEPPLACSITAYGGVEDPEVKRGDIECWRMQTCSTFVLRMFPGDHFFLQQNRSLFFESLGGDLDVIVRAHT